MARKHPGFTLRDAFGKIFKVEFRKPHSWLMARLPSGHWTDIRMVDDPEVIESLMEWEVPEEPEWDAQVEPIGRGFFLVRSVSRPDVSHVVDMEPNVYGVCPTCSCENARFRKAQCHHLRAVERYMQSANAGSLAYSSPASAA